MPSLTAYALRAIRRGKYMGIKSTQAEKKGARRELKRRGLR